MNYLQWNNALAKRYFDDVTEAQTFLCITKDTLKDLSGLASDEEALADFIKAVTEGPEWTQINGCRTILSKAHNCLYPDPNWSRTRTDRREKHILAYHVGWRDWPREGEPLTHPPYLAYLLLLVLAWTERNDNEHGREFYDPLNRILKLNGDKRINALGTRYTYNNNELTFNDLWEDLQNWSLQGQGPVLDLPPQDRYADDYVYIARYYGLLNAVDLRKLDSVFFELSEQNLIHGRITPEQLAAFVADTRETRALFSNDGRQVLVDKNRRAALGRLLISKYKVWDGSPSEDYAGSSRGSHQLLRVIKEGRFHSLIKLRSILAMDRVDIEEGVNYPVDAGVPNGEEPLSVMWPLRSEFSSIFQIAEDDPETHWEVCVPALGIKARRENQGNKPFVFHKQILTHLLGAYVEVDQVQPGRHYLLLERSGNSNPGIEQYLTPNYAVYPDGYEAFTLRVPENANQHWPDNYLPPLATERTGGAPRIKVQSVFAIGRDRYLAGFPISITSTSDNYAPRIATHDIPDICEGILQIPSDHEGEITILLDPVGNANPIGTNKSISISRCGPDLSDSKQWERFEPLDIPVYPNDKIQITGQSFLFNHSGIAYYHAGAPISISLDPVDGDPNRSLRINGQNIRSPLTLNEEQVRDAKSVVVELRSGNEIIDLQRISFRSRPEIHITGISKDADHPKVLRGNVSFSAIPDEADHLESLTCSYLGERQNLELPARDCNWLDFLTKYGEINLPPNAVFHLDFILGDVVLKTCWFQTPQMALPPQPAPPAAGFNNFGAVLDGVFGNLPGRNA